MGCYAHSTGYFAKPRLVDSSLRRIFDEARDYALNPCVLPRSPETEEPPLGATVMGSATS